MEQQPTTPSQWSRLPPSILSEIARRLSKTSPFPSPAASLRLRSVCHSWRSSLPIVHRFPLDLPFPITPNPNHSLRGRFSLSQSTLHFVQPSSSPSSLPWILRLEAAKDTANGKKWKPLNPLSKFSSHKLPKWFPKSLDLLSIRVSVIVSAYALRFLHMDDDDVTKGGGAEEKDDWTTRTIKALVKQHQSSSSRELVVDPTLAEELKSTLILRVAVSTSPWTAGRDDYAVVAVHGQGKLGFYKLGDEKWTPVTDESRYHDVAYHGGKFYAVDYQGAVVAIGQDLKAAPVAAPLPGRGSGQIKYLVESGDGSLYLVDCYPGSMDVVHVNVYKLDEDKKVWGRVNRLNGHVFFVGNDCSFSVSAKDFPALKGNCVYLLVKCCNVRGEEDVADGVQDLETGVCGPVEVFQPDKMTMFTNPAWLKSIPRGLKK